jgi:hypothetical protein
MRNPATSARVARCRDTEKSKIKSPELTFMKKITPKTIATFDTHQKFTSPATAGFLIPLLLACFGLAPMAQAVGPDTDGTIPGANNGEGIGVLVSRTTGVWNTGTGFEALNHLTAGNQNTATGVRALNSDINGGFNTATGVYSLFSNTSGFFNSATGAYALAHNTTGGNNTANGYSALYFNTEGGSNTAIGFGALRKNVDGSSNTAVGQSALLNGMHAFGATAIGINALQNDDVGSNTATGFNALAANTTGFNNAALGVRALASNIDGTNNTAIGNLALTNNVSTSNHVAVGRLAGSGITTANNNIIIGQLSGVHSVFGQVSDRCSIDNIYGAPVSGATFAFVLIDSDGRLGTFTVAANGPDPGGFSPKRVQPQTIPDAAKQAMLHRRVEEQQATIAELKSNGRATTETNRNSHGPVQRAGRANPKSERATGSEQTCAADG